MKINGGRGRPAVAPAGFEDYVNARGDALGRVARGLTGDPAGAEDLVQEALIKVFPRWDRIDPDGRDAYVYRVLVNTSRKMWRRRWHGEVPFAELPDHVGVDEWDDVDLRRALGVAVHRLPSRQREVVFLRYLGGLTQEEVGAALGISPGTVKSQASKALAKLRMDEGLAGYEVLRGERR